MYLFEKIMNKFRDHVNNTINIIENILNFIQNLYCVLLIFADSIILVEYTGKTWEEEVVSL